MKANKIGQLVHTLPVPGPPHMSLYALAQEGISIFPVIPSLFVTMNTILVLDMRRLRCILLMQHEIPLSCSDNGVSAVLKYILVIEDY